MKQFPRLTIFLAILLLFFGILPDVSAYTISSTKVNPPGYQAAGTPMTVMFVVDFPWRGNETFPQGSELQGSTDLDEAYWVPVLVLDGEDIRMTVQSGKSLVISGWYLSYPSYQDVHLMVTLTGKIPATPSSKQDLFRIQETDSNKNIVSTAHVEMPEAPKDGSLYRVLFLTGLILFAMTFVINTVAELVRLHFRKRAMQL